MEWIDFVPKQILVIHHNPMMISLLQFGLSKQGYHVKSYEDRHYTDSSHLDLIILDSQQAKERDILSTIQSFQHSPPILLLAESSADVERNEAGKGLYFVKENLNVPFEFEELNSRLKSIWKEYRGKIQPYHWQVSVQHKAFKLNEIEIYLDCMEIRSGPVRQPLRKAEIYLLMQLLQRPEQYTSAEQLKLLLAKDMVLDRRRVEYYVNELRRKIEVFEDQILIQTKRRRGYCLKLKGVS
ncbi:winged helix-turn-helix domain-containing protein [Paenibacillus sp. LS1]|uniref:response regulator transcription factor n=1 Tax=Paenibacillus sp. LS1 TaxID=2992120 RepID=UPI002230A4C2|nr:winged helix-turn-helix domain-containing protein [Paenibacillus sp. LS1]MCW3794461.1 winged helix-turn-helix domain-containing protein [Paenibacillus sp. LS1]